MPVENRLVKKGFAREVVGLRLWEPQDNQTIDELRALWARHPVLVFRRQALSEDELADFSALFGPLERVVRTEWASPVRPEVGLISNLKDAQAKPIGGLGDGEIQWHSDQSYMLNPATGAMLYALELPSSGGNTMFSNMYMAYDAVPPSLKEKLKGKKALHIHEYKRAEKADLSGDISNIPHHYHPVFITHPDTGRKTLFVDRLMTSRVEGVDARESDAILEQLYAIGERREFIYEHVWQLGDFLMWDNRCTIHARTDFPKDEPRLLRRCTVEGEPLHE